MMFPYYTEPGPLTDRTEACPYTWMHSPHTWRKPNDASTVANFLHDGALWQWRDCPGRMITT